MWLVFRPVAQFLPPLHSSQLLPCLSAPWTGATTFAAPRQRDSRRPSGAHYGGVEAFAQMTPEPRYQTPTPNRFRGYRLPFGSSGEDDERMENATFYRME